jgi:ketosteroid isomerase-like protein
MIFNREAFTEFCSEMTVNKYGAELRRTKIGRNPMKVRLAVALLSLAISFGLPTFAQEQKAVDPEQRQQIEGVFMQFQEAYNKHDAAALAALYTQTAVEIRSWQGLATGREAIVKRFAGDFASGPGKMVNELVAVYPIGNDICAIFETTVGGKKGRAVTIYVREGDGWKIRMTYVRF